MYVNLEQPHSSLTSDPGYIYLSCRKYISPSLLAENEASPISHESTLTSTEEEKYLDSYSAPEKCQMKVAQVMGKYLQEIWVLRSRIP